MFKVQVTKTRGQTAVGDQLRIFWPSGAFPSRVLSCTDINLLRGNAISTFSQYP